MGRGPGVRVVGEEAIQIDFRWKGVRIRERVRLAPTKANLVYCRGWKRRIEEEIAHGTFDYFKHFPDGKHSHLSANPSGKLSAFLRAYLQSLGDSIQPETAREYGNDAETVAKGLKDPPVRLVTRAKIREWISTLTLSKSRIDSLLRPLRGAFKQAVEDGALKENPLEGFEVRRVKAPGEEVIDPFTPDEISALGKTVLGDLWTFWAWTGLRSGEVIALRWNDVDALCQTISIRRATRMGREKTPKTASGARMVSCLGPASDVLLRRKREGDLLFTNPNTGGSWHEAKSLNRAFTRACRDAGVRRRYVYQLRHTFATWALSSGENPSWIAKQMGHSDTTMLFKHYGKWMPQMDPAAGSKMLNAASPKARGGQRAA